NWMIAARVPESATAEMIRQSWNGRFGWRWMFTAVTVPSLVFFASAWFVPESPRWLVKNRRSDQARRTLARIGGAAYADGALFEIEKTIGAETQSSGAWTQLL